MHFKVAGNQRYIVCKRKKSVKNLEQINVVYLHVMLVRMYARDTATEKAFDTLQAKD